MVFFFARKEKRRLCSNSARADFLILCPRACSPLTRCDNDLLVHCTSLIGSPLGCSNPSRSQSRVSSLSTSGFLPPPAFLTGSPSLEKSPASTSLIPRLIVFWLTFASRATSAILPRSLASIATYCLHCFSLRLSRICAYFC